MNDRPGEATTRDRASELPPAAHPSLAHFVRHLWLKLEFLRRHPVYRSMPLRALARLLRWRLQCALGRPAVVALPRCGGRFYLPPRWGGEGSTLIYVARDLYEPEITHLDRLVRAGDTVVDAGANFGIYTVVAGLLVGGSGRVLAFEPNPRVLPILERNVALNALGHASVIAAALAERDGDARLYHHADSGAVASSIARGDTPERGFDLVPTCSLDGVVGREGRGRVDLVKLDIEGAELSALRGADGVIARHRPIVLFELNAEAAGRFGETPDAAWRWLEARGYRFFAFDESGRLYELTEPPVEESWGYQNVIALQPAHFARFEELAGVR